MLAYRTLLNKMDDSQRAELRKRKEKWHEERQHFSRLNDYIRNADDQRNHTTQIPSTKTIKPS